MNNEKECAAYFRSQNGYQRCLEEIRKKWRSYGRAAGKITLRHASEAERCAIGGMTGRKYLDDTVSFSVLEFEQGLQKTRFAPVDLREMLEAYFGEKIITKQEQREQEQKEKDTFLKILADGLEKKDGQNSSAAPWLFAMFQEKQYGYQTLMREYEKNKFQAEDTIKNVCCAVEKLSSWEQEEGCPLAVAAAEISGNPHYFDRNTTAGILFVHAVCWKKNRELPANTYQWRELLQEEGIVPDNISSMVHAFGIRLKKQENWHPAYDAFCDCREPYVLTMENLKGITEAQAVGRCVYIVENEMVFSYLLEQIQQCEVALLCTSGQPRYAALKLISLIVQSGIPVYYSGDLDPDGIGIADRLWLRFGEGIRFWRMSPEDYRNSLSKEAFGEAGKKKLEHICHPALQETARAMQATGKAGYQENILKELVADITKKMEIYS